MPIDIIPFDTQYPPTWESISGGVPLPGIASVVDADSALRPTVGEDKVNYFNTQRPQGDLFKRDLILNKQLKTLIDYLATRSGPCMNTPDITLQPQTWVVVGRMRFDPTNCPSGAWLVAAQVRYLGAGAFPTTGTPTVADCELVIADTAAAVTATISAVATPTGSMFLVADRANRSGTTMLANGASKEYELRLYNNHATASIIASATVIWQVLATT